MDYAAQDRKPGQVLVAMQSLGEARASLEDRLRLLDERTRSIRFAEPRPADPSEKMADVDPPRADLAAEIWGQADSLRRMERFVQNIITELQI